MMNNHPILNDFKNIRTAIIEKRSHIAVFILAVLLATPAILMIVFGIIFFIGAPMDFDGVIAYPGEPVYDSFMIWFLGITILINLTLLLLMFYFSGHSQKTMIYLGETLNLEKVIYVETSRYHIYLSELNMITYHKKLDSIAIETNRKAIQEMMEKYIFWIFLDKLDNWTVIEKSKLTTLRINYKEGRTNYLKTYRIHQDDTERISHYHEMISTRTYGNQNVQSFSNYIIKSINHSSYLPVSSKIQAEIIKMTY